MRVKCAKVYLLEGCHAKLALKIELCCIFHDLLQICAQVKHGKSVVPVWDYGRLRMIFGPVIDKIVKSVSLVTAAMGFHEAPIDRQWCSIKIKAFWCCLECALMSSVTELCAFKVRTTDWAYPRLL